MNRVMLMMVATLLLVGCKDAKKVEQFVVPVTRGPLVFEAMYYGELQAAKSVAVHVPSIADTWQLTVDSVLADGTRVKKGDVILSFVKETLEMDLRDELDKLEVARAERRKVLQGLERERIDLVLEVQRKNLALDRAKLDVVQGVNFISKIDLEKAKINVAKAQLELKLSKQALRAFNQKKATALKIEDIKVKTAEQEVESKRKGLSLVQILAPVDGIIYAPYTRLNWQRTKVAPGVVARPGDKVLELPDLSQYNAHVYVRQRDVALLNLEDEATVSPVILPQEQIKAKIIKKAEFATTRNERFRTKTPEGGLKEYLVTLALERAPTQLRPGNSAKVQIKSVLAKDVVLVPIVALKKGKNGKYTATLKGGNVAEVEVGRTTHTMAEVISGLSPGQEVYYQKADMVQSKKGKGRQS